MLRVRVERHPIHTVRLMAHAHRLQRHRREHGPLRLRPHLIGKPGCVCNVAPESRPQSSRTLLTNQAPELQRTKASAERKSPVAKVLYLRVCGSLQVTGVGGHHAHESCRFAHVIQRTVEGDAEPFVRIDHDGVGTLDTVPERTTFGKNHRGPRHRGVDVQPDSELARHRRDCTNRVDRGACGCAGCRHNGAGNASRLHIGGNQFAQGIGAHRVRVVRRHEAHVVTAEAGQQRRLLYGAVRVRTAVHYQRRGLCLQPAARQRVAGRTFSRAQQCDECARAGGVLDHAAPRIRKPHHLPHPVTCDFFQFGQCGARLPR